MQNEVLTENILCVSVKVCFFVCDNTVRAEQIVCGGTLAGSRSSIQTAVYIQAKNCWCVHCVNTHTHMFTCYWSICGIAR